MEVLLSTHAKERIDEQKMNKQQVIEDIKKMPPIKTKIRWFLKNGHIAIVAPRGEGVVMVVTIISTRKYNNSTKKGVRTL